MTLPMLSLRKTDFAWILFLSLLAWAPLPLASNRPLFAVILTFIIGLCLLFAALKQRWQIVMPLPLKLAVWLIILAGVQQAIGLLPLWPAELVVFPEMAKQTGNSFSLHPAQSWFSLLNWVGVLTAGGLAYFFAHQRDRAWFLVKVATVIITGYAGYGIIAHLSGCSCILWLEKWDYFGALTSTFVNRNSFATFAGLGLLIASTLILKSTARNRWCEGMLWLLAAGVIALALLLTQSRGGQAATLLGLLTLASLWLSQRPWPSWRKLIVMGGAGLLLLLAMLNFNPRWLTASDEWQFRQSIYTISVDAIADRPVLGSGLGTFEERFRMFRDGRLPYEISSRVDKAHNTYLAVAVEQGLISLSILLAAMLLLTYQLWRGYRQRQRDRLLPMLGVSTVVLAGSHALVDFSAEMPAVALLLATLIGLTLAQSNSSESRKVMILPQLPLLGGGIILVMLAASWLQLLAQTWPAELVVKRLQNGAELNTAELIELYEQLPAATLRPHAQGLIAHELLAQEKLALANAKTTVTSGLTAAPAQPYAWFRLAKMIGNEAEPDLIALDRALFYSLTTGPFESHLIYRRLRFALAYWYLLEPATQHLLTQEMQQAFDWRPKITLGHIKYAQGRTVLRQQLRTDQLPLLNDLIAKHY